MALLEIKNLSFTYNGAKNKALSDINIEIESGDFVLLCGESGCGKTTLLKLLKKQLRPAGKTEGVITYGGVNIDELDERASVTEIGYVMQNPDNQTVTDKVWHELAFGLESLGESTDVIRRKVAEICGFFGIGEWYHKKTSELSGGQKQLLSLASVMVMNPSVLVLDEPTAQLDPIAASEFLASLRKINEELGITVIIAEHRLEEVFPMASKVVLMDKASVCFFDTPRSIGEKLANNASAHKLSIGMPAAIRLFSALDGMGINPLTVKEGKKYIVENYKSDIKRADFEAIDFSERNIAIEVSGGYFRYERELPDVLSGLDLKVYENEILCILGANGAGKTTLLRILSGVRRLYKGKYRVWDKKIKEYSGNSLYRGNISYLPQNPQNLFVKNTVYADLFEVTKLLGMSKADAEQRIGELGERLDIKHLFESHPYDLSGGEQQKAALAKILLMNPKIILLDEPTKGLDAYSKKTFSEILAELKKDGKTIVIVTHDVEFAAEYADRCAMFFDGQIVSISNRVDFFATNRYYTTAAARMTRPMFENAVTVDMAVKLCQANGKRTSHDTE